MLPELTVAENIWLGREPRTPLRACSTGARCAPHTSGCSSAYRPAARPVGRRRHAQRRRRASWSRSPARCRPRRASSRSTSRPRCSRPPSAARLFDIVAQAASGAGLLVLFVSHRLDEVFEIADRVTVLRNGRHVFAAPRTADLTRGRAGAPHGRARRRRSDAGRRSRRPGATPIAISVQRRRRRHRCSGSSAGEIVGLGGLVGAAARRLARRLAGLEPGVDGRLPASASGTVTVRTPARGDRPRHRLPDRGPQARRHVRRPAGAAQRQRRDARPACRGSASSIGAKSGAGCAPSAANGCAWSPRRCARRSRS